MDSEARLMRALASASPARRDPAFTLAVMRRAELQRFKTEAMLSMLRTAAFAAAAAALVAPVLAWAPGHLDGLLQGGVTTAALLTLVAGGRLMAQRIAVRTA